MASKRIQGITIEIGGDTTKLQTALKGVDKELSKTQGNLKDINKLLKLNPGNTELLTQKQKNLSESIKATEDRLKTLKSTQKDALSPDEYDALQREIIETEQRLEGLKDEYKAFGSVAQQKIAAAAQAMQDMGGKISDAGRKMQEIGGIIPGELKKVGTAINEHVLQPMLQVAKVVGAAGIGVTTALTKGAVDAAAEYEQLVGGVETLFKNSSAKVIKNAKNAYKTSGRSANDYMKTVTSFSASLLNSLGGNTDKAARLADMAIQDMSDNANKFGADFDSIEAAYRGFAKEQYQLLDNLSLGYAGTKAGMEQLIRRAEELDSTFKVTHKTVKKGKEVNDELAFSYDDIIQAIHIVQKDMGVTGTTAAEASKTIEGSMAAAKAAWTNLLTAIGTGDDVKGATKTALEAAGTYLSGNLFPTIKTSLSGLTEVWDYIIDRVIFHMPEIVSTVTEWIGKIPKWINDHIIAYIPWLMASMYITVSKTLWAISGSIAKWLGDGSTTSEIFTGLKTSLDNVIGAVKDIGGALRRLWDETLKDYVKGKVKTFITTTLPKLTGFLGDVADKISSLIDWFNNLDPEIKNTILDVGLAIIAGSLAVSGIGKIIEKGGEWITNIGSIIQAISGPGGLISFLTGPGGIVFALAGVALFTYTHWEDIKALWKKGTEWIKEKVDWLKEAIPKAWKALWDKMPEPVKDAVRTIRSWLTKVISKIDEALSKLSNFLTKNRYYDAEADPSRAGTSDSNGYWNSHGVYMPYAHSNSYSSPLQRANGGPVFEGQRAVVGEVAPEYLRVINGHAVVTPMTNQPGRLGGDTTVNITINPQPGQSAEDIAAAVKRVFVREMQQREAAYA